MTHFAVASVVALFAVWVVVGAKLLLLARRTRGFPESALGLALLLQAGLGYPLGVLSAWAGEWEHAVAVVGSILSNTGCFFLFVFTAHVFHDRSRVAWAGVGAAAALLTVHAVGNAAAQAAATTEAEKNAAILFWGGGILLLSGAAWGWTGLESLRYHARLRKRARLGLLDPIVANRMKLWGAMGVVAFGAVVVNAAVLYGGSGVTGHRSILPVLTSLAGLVISVCLVLAFLPPRAYLEAVRRRAAEAT